MKGTIKSFIPHRYGKQEAKIEKPHSLSVLPFPPLKLQTQRVICNSTLAVNLEQKLPHSLLFQKQKQRVSGNLNENDDLFFPLTPNLMDYII